MSPFDLMRVNWRVDTLVLNVTLVVAIVISTFVLTNKMASNAALNRAAFNSVAAQMEKDSIRLAQNSQTQQALIERIQVIETKNKELQDNLSGNIDRLIAIQKRLEKADSK